MPSIEGFRPLSEILISKLFDWANECGIAVSVPSRRSLYPNRNKGGLNDVNNRFRPLSEILISKWHTLLRRPRGRSFRPLSEILISKYEGECEKKWRSFVSVPSRRSLYPNWCIRRLGSRIWRFPSPLGDPYIQMKERWELIRWR